MIWSASREIHPDLGVGLPSFEQKPLSLSLFITLEMGTFMTVCHPVERRLKVLPLRSACRVIFAFPPFPIFSVVPRKEASSVLALVMWVFSSLSVRWRCWARKSFTFCLISSASTWLPHTPISQSSAYLRYFILMKSGSLTILDGVALICFTTSLNAGVWVAFRLTIRLFLRESLK